MSAARALPDPITADPGSVDPAALDAAGFASLAGATPEQLADLARFETLLGDWNGRMNLVGPATLPQFWSRHAWDSAQLLPLAPDARTWADLGAGAGFPGLVLAILLNGRADPGGQGPRVHLVESMAKRCRFLAEVVTELALPAQVINARAEDVKLKVDVVTARAVAPLTRLLSYAQPFMARGARALFLKGQDAEAEIAEARAAWRFDVDILPSQSDPRGRILSIERLSRA
ncbi:16S rRNA (guanine(527)-N(7))-methyltransferase RsmG [Caulobacter sp. KR2-114]|uniref:16S rRNA (guanine(527)-N(7))-methyltransferase RsmG n=1 Tax=Caulobacter sp. KR2-114 TaxID=3400912 RepID=UPI003BFE8AFE